MWGTQATQWPWQKSLMSHSVPLSTDMVSWWSHSLLNMMFQVVAPKRCHPLSPKGNFLSIPVQYNKTFQYKRRHKKKSKSYVANSLPGPPEEPLGWRIFLLEGKQSWVKWAADVFKLLTPNFSLQPTAYWYMTFKQESSSFAGIIYYKDTDQSSSSFFASSQFSFFTKLAKWKISCEYSFSAMVINCHTALC